MKANIQAEQALLGAILLDPERVMPEAAQYLAGEDFYSVPVREVFRRCVELYADGKPIDIITATENLPEAYRVMAAECAKASPTARNYGGYIEAVRNTARRIRAWEQAIALTETLESGGELGECQAQAAAVCEELNQSRKDKTVSAKDGFLAFASRKTTPKSYVTTGFANLDRYTYLDRGDYVIIGGRPSSGKTALTLQMMLHMAKTHRVVYFSLETSAEKIFDRLVCRYVGIPFEQIKQQTITDENWVKNANHYDSFSKLNFHVVEAAGWTVQQIRSKAAQLRAEVVFIDYLSLIQAEGKSVYERVTNISRDLHTMAQQSKLLTVALSQLNREGKGAPDMTHLRESGQIEQDADAVLLLHQTDREQRELIIAKNKEGRVGSLSMAFRGEYQSFLETVSREE